MILFIRILVGLSCLVVLTAGVLLVADGQVRLPDLQHSAAIAASIVTGAVAIAGAFAANRWLSLFNETRENTFGKIEAALNNQNIALNKQNEELKKQRSSRNMLAYTELDRFYADILKLAIQHPFLRVPIECDHDCKCIQKPYDPFPDYVDFELPQTFKSLGELEAFAKVESFLPHHRQAQYDAYAFMVWNFLETIHDHASPFSSGQRCVN